MRSSREVRVGGSKFEMPALPTYTHGKLVSYTARRNCRFGRGISAEHRGVDDRRAMDAASPPAQIQGFGRDRFLRPSQNASGRLWRESARCARFGRALFVERLLGEIIVGAGFDQIGSDFIRGHARDCDHGDRWVVLANDSQAIDTVALAQVVIQDHEIKFAAHECFERSIFRPRPR